MYGFYCALHLDVLAMPMHNMHDHDGDTTIKQEKNATFDSVAHSFPCKDRRAAGPSPVDEVPDAQTLILFLFSNHPSPPFPLLPRGGF